MNKTFTLTLTGQEQIIDAGLDSFCRGTGWTDQSEITQEQHARDKIRDYIRDTAAAYNAVQAAEAARQAALTQTGAALGTLTLTLTTE